MTNIKMYKVSQFITALIGVMNACGGLIVMFSGNGTGLINLVMSCFVIYYVYETAKMQKESSDEA